MAAAMGWEETYGLRCFTPYLYRARNLVERFFNKIKQIFGYRDAI